MKKMKSSGADVISYLPSHILQKILKCLPLQDAVRTSIFSRIWRYKWVTTTELIFDSNFCKNLKENHKLEKIIYQVLLLHEGPIIKFSLWWSAKNSSDLDHWMLFLSKNNIQEFTLYQFNPDNDSMSCLFTFLQLRDLELVNCLFKPPPTFKGFIRLVNLNFDKVVIRSERFGSFISSCPSLKRLEICRCFGLEFLDVDAPNLKLFAFYGDVMSICLYNTPLLAEVFIGIRKHSTVERNEEVSSLKWSKLFCGAPAIEKLTLVLDLSEVRKLEYYILNLHETLAVAGVPSCSCQTLLMDSAFSDLPQSIIETILTKLPLRDAVRTSILSTKWRYKWATITQLAFDDKCVTPSHDRAVAEINLVKFVSRFLFLHDGPIHKFTLSTSYLQNTPEIDQWLLFLSRKDIKELVLEFGEGELFRVPSCLFTCRKLARLELVRCEFDPPPTFRGFLSLKYLNLQQVLVAPEVVESLISSCPLLESLTLSYSDHSSSCNFEKFLGGVPCLERLIGHIYFTKYLSIGSDLGKVPIMYPRLKVIELHQVSFEDMKEILVILRLIVNSPNLQELHISGSSNTSAATECPDLEFWEMECPHDCTLEQLKTVKMTDMSAVPHEMKFIRFLLGNSPLLEVMSITPSVYVTDGKLNMLVELVRLRRASSQAEIIFIQDQI
ncbi:hypothetical protein RJ640_017845 [Escallonia rubra]|uniref:F-box domain-containing protein n=1 Tax=Escallonia rubra TaxID=112253 RepID=A0AA88UGE6_9ASTE|nr:hypothetical protein RJ640_017845 [Escallonia rubra]